MQQVTSIVEIIDGWPEGTKLTWDALIKRIARRLRIQPARQTLARHLTIKVAYQTRKERLRKETVQVDDVRLLKQRLARTIAENERLREENERYREHLVQWQYNAYKRGLKQHHLEEPLPTIDRQGSR